MNKLLLAAELMHKYGAHGATDITGFGLFGHAKSLVEFQKNKVRFFIDTLPILKYMLIVSEVTGSKQKLLSGLAPETSGMDQLLKDLEECLYL